MKKWEGFQKGVNLGGWLSQCDHSKEHYDTFITEQDFAVIAGWGCDHVRLPIDYDLVQTKDGDIIEDGFFYIDTCFDWCRQHKLNMVLDLHKTLGHSFDEDEGEQGFFYNEALIRHFLNLWDALAKRYGQYPDNIAFELLNEVVNESDNAPWMDIVRRAIATIRPHAPRTKILIGSYMNNSVTTVTHIIPPVDDNIIYNFHCYEPLLFTHQGAAWIKEMLTDFRMRYPLPKAQFNAAADSVAPNFRVDDCFLPEGDFSSRYFELLFADALQYAEQQGVMLYCGEYGVINLADTESTLIWYQHINSVLNKYGIGHAIWSYKEMSFGISDAGMDSICDEIIQCM